MIKLKSLLLELLSPTDAAEIFRRFGVDNALTISKDELKAKYKELVLKHHPDKGGDTYNAQMINAAYDILKNHNISPSYRGNNSGGSSFNEKNINDVIERAWEISGRPPQTRRFQYTFWNWDGFHFRGVFIVHATIEKAFEISQMMVKWDDFPSVAVFFSKPNIQHTAFLINLRGQKVSPPRKYEHNSINQNPSNDSRFVDMLRKNL